jgi:hypothetical protein
MNDIEIHIYISEQCKESHFFDLEYAGELYEALTKTYPGAKINFHFVRGGGNYPKPYITKIETGNAAGIEVDIEVRNICEEVCQFLITKNKDRRLHPPTGDIVPFQFKNFTTGREIEDYLARNNVNLCYEGFF